jgi:3-phosphoshikimate 1-carboxyvinyltransferase
MEMKMPPSSPLKGELSPPPDKSISHRAIIFASIARGKSVIRNLLRAADPVSTMNAFRRLGVRIEDRESEIIIHGAGLEGLREPVDVIDCGNSGTTIRLLAGLLSGQPFLTVLTGDDSLRRRPMKRVVEPLKRMGATILGRDGDRFAPLAIKGGALQGIQHVSEVASAQVKSSILLAGLYADGETVVEEPNRSRDHTERMLPALGADLTVRGLKVYIKGGRELEPFEITVPGDFSSAAFFICAALMVPGSEILIRNTGINPTRTGLLEVLRMMGGDIEIVNQRDVSGEPVADLICRHSGRLRGVEVPHELVPSMIDEFPVLSVLATQAEGETVVREAGELRVKESDRIATTTRELRKMGADVEELPDGMIIKGPVKLKGGTVSSHDDHRLAMALAVAGLVAEGDTTIEGTSSVAISYPDFFSTLKTLTV